MSVKPILNVVRFLHVEPSEVEFAKNYCAEWMRERYSEDERRQQYNNFIEHHNSQTGFYVKSGGGQATPNLQEAQIFGWSRKAKENLSSYKAPYYEIIPVTIEVAK